MHRNLKEVNSNIVKIVKRKAKDIVQDSDKTEVLTTSDMKNEIKELASCIRLLSLAVLSLYNDIIPEENTQIKKKNRPEFTSVTTTTDFKEATETLRKIAAEKAADLNEEASEN